MDLSNGDLLKIYRLLVMGRKIEEAMCHYPHGAGYHPALGEEGTIIGSFFNLREEDVIVPHYRGAILAAYLRGADLRKLIAGIFGKETAYNRSRYRADICMPFKFNIIGMWSGLLGSSLNLSTGAGLAHKLQHTDNVVVVTFGEGTSNLGSFHEAINLAACLNLPMVFVCQNNQYAISTPSCKALKCRSVADRAIGYGIPGVEVDGNDILEVHRTIQNAVLRARQAQGPTLIEALTYRIKGHFTADPAAYQPPEEVVVWKKKDPVRRFKNKLIQLGVISKDKAEYIIREVDEDLSAAIKLAEQDPETGPEALGINDVFAPTTYQRAEL
jgi:acetoin:2,6-dichlorophenolindophenol oxidoreductase subunit alpha